MSNLIDRDEVLKVLQTYFGDDSKVIEKILSLPLQQQGGNEKIRELIEKKLEEEQKSYDKAYVQCYQELLREIDNLPPNN